MDKACKKICFASVVSEIKQSPLFLTVKARLFETPRANLNGVRVTLAFIDEIIENQEKYVGLPLNADVKALANGQYDRLGHLYNARTGEFHSTQIGSFYKFEREDFDEGSYLVGYARIQKRNKAICRAIGELFADSNLNFSFEITCGSYEDLEDGTMLIDVADDNFLEGMAIVSFPACEDATALELVAELTDTNGKGDNEMTDVKETVIETENKEEIIAEAEVQAETEIQAEQEVQNETEVKAESEEAACDEPKKENATVYVTECHTETVEVHAYDTETDTCVNKRVTVDESVTTSEEDATLVANDETVIAGDNDSESEEETYPEEGANTDAVENKKTAEELIAEQQTIIAELVKTVEDLKNELAEIKEMKVAIASTKKDNETLNPFLAEIKTVDKPKYSLLDSAKENISSYTLI